jgi:hypothetical protein
MWVHSGGPVGGTQGLLITGLVFFVCLFKFTVLWSSAKHKQLLDFFLEQKTEKQNQ